MITDISSKVFPDDVYLCHETTGKQLKARLKKDGFDNNLLNIYDFDEILRGGCKTNSAWLFYDSAQPLVCFVVIRDLSILHLVHELMHTAFHILIKIGHRMNKVQQTEPAAYLQQYYLEKSLIALNAEIIWSDKSS